MLILFLLLGIAVHQKITIFSFNYIWATIALASSYVAATTINDIADKKIDSVNHPSSKGRPLITGEATERDLYIVHFLSVFIVLIFSWLIGIKAIVILALSLLINYIYSLPPFKLSYRTHFAPLILSVAYVFVPYWLGTVVTNSTIQKQESLFIIGLLLIFFGRIILKDFRDRKGDALYGKPTFLLRYGKSATCGISFISIFSGNILMFAGLPIKNIIVLFLLEVYFIAIFFMLYKLWKKDKSEDEQTAIGIGAKMGNGLLLTVLGFFVLLEYNAPNQMQILFITVIVAVFLSNFFMLISRPNYAFIGYRG